MNEIEQDLRNQLAHLDERIALYDMWIMHKPENDLTMMAYIALDALKATRALLFIEVTRR